MDSIFSKKYFHLIVVMPCGFISRVICFITNHLKFGLTLCGIRMSQMDLSCGLTSSTTGHSGTSVRGTISNPGGRGLENDAKVTKQFKIKYKVQSLNTTS